MADVPPRPKQGLLRHAPLAAILCTAVIGYFLLDDYLTFDTLRDNREALLAFRDAHFAQMIATFIALYVVIVSFSLPGASVASVTGGFLFGLPLGTLFNVVSASMGATVIFLAARAGMGRAMAARMDASDGTLKKIRNGLREHEVHVLLLLRLVPAVPFFVANLLPAMVGVKLVNFVWTTVVGIIPGTIVFTWIGVGLGEVFDRGESPDLSLLWEPQIIGPILALSALAAMPILLKALRGKKEF